MKSLAGAFCATVAVAGCACWPTSAHAAEQRWHRIDFDADLTTYLVDLDSVSRSGGRATIMELDAPGRTAISVGLGNHLLMKRVFNCADGTQHLEDVVLYRAPGGRGEPLAHSTAEFKVEPGTLDETQMKIACDGAAAPGDVEYGSVAEAVRKAFGDAVKLPREQSNRTLRGLGMDRPLSPP